MDLLHHLGAHCSEAGCGQLDFLPFSCPSCSGTFCLAHHKPLDHAACSQLDPSNRNTMPLCPVCQQYVYAPAHASRDGVVSAHISSGCNSHLLSSHMSAQKSTLASATKCALQGCKNPERLATLECARCSGTYCIKHRLPVTHKCGSLPEGETLATSSKRKAPGVGYSSASAAAAAPADKHAAGNALLAKLKQKREAKEAAAAQSSAYHNSSAATAHAAAQAAAFPVNAAAAQAQQKSRPTGSLTLQQIRAGINASASAAVAAVANVLPAALGGSPSPAPAASPAAPASSSPSPPASASASPPPASYRPLVLTAALKARALGDTSVPESSRLYLNVDVTAIKSKRAPVLCFFASKLSIGKVLDVICDHAGIENVNHVANGKRLYVTAPRTRATFPGELTLQLLEGTLVQGDTVQITRHPLQ